MHYTRRCCCSIFRPFWESKKSSCGSTCAPLVAGRSVGMVMTSVFAFLVNVAVEAMDDMIVT